jgi:hypothetical protein
MLWHASAKLGYMHDPVTRADVLSRADGIGLVGRTPWSVAVGAQIACLSSRAASSQSQWAAVAACMDTVVRGTGLRQMSGLGGAAP